MTRITADEAARLWHGASDDELKELAQRTRARWHEPDKATYMTRDAIAMKCTRSCQWTCLT